MRPSRIEPPNPWQILRSQQVHRNPWFCLRQDQVRTHTGDEITFTFMEHPGAVSIIPVTPEGEIVLIRQYRHTVKEWCWEIPMGGRGEENPEITAMRELKEEIGGTCRDIQHIAWFYGNLGVSDIRCDVFLARDVTLGESHPEVAELIHYEILSRKQVMHMARTSEISDGFSALSLLICENYLD